MDEGRFVTAVLRPAKRPSGKEIKPFLRRLLRAIRAHWPNAGSCCGHSHYCGPEVLDWCRANDLDYILGIAPTATLRPCPRSRSQHEGEIRGRAARRQASSFHGVLRRRAKLEPGRADHRPRRAGAEGPDTRFVVTNLSKRNARGLYEDVSCRRGQAENHIKSWNDPSGGGSHVLLQGDSQPVSAVPDMRRRWLMWGLRVSMPKRSMCGASPSSTVAPPPHQDCRPRRRDEDHDPGALAAPHAPLRIILRFARTHTAPRHMTDGA